MTFAGGGLIRRVLLIPACVCAAHIMDTEAAGVAVDTTATAPTMAAGAAVGAGAGASREVLHHWLNAAL
jgi:hypothetical protein